MMHILIIGAGASGLMAARTLQERNHRVTVVEARSRIGGRIYTHTPEGFSSYIDGGAEFVHGDLPLTSSLLNQAEITMLPMNGAMYRYEQGRLTHSNCFEEEWQTLMTKLNELQDDIPLGTFLDTHFPQPHHAAFRKNIERFVEGYNAADVRDASAIAMRNEWAEDEDPQQFRPKGGYSRLMEFLVDRIGREHIFLDWKAMRVEHNASGVVIHSSDGRKIRGDKVIITTSVGVLKTGDISFNPPIPSLESQINNIGFEGVVRIVIEFDSAFWREVPEMKNLNFLITDATVPTWWPHAEAPNIITGWIGGPSVREHVKTDQEYLTEAISSLAYIFGMEPGVVKSRIKASAVFQWLSDPYTHGAYSYAKLPTREAVEFFVKGLNNVVFFSGEALYTGPHKGTVEAALASGQDIANLILDAIDSPDH
jgi:monoamine oxidase